MSSDTQHVTIQRPALEFKSSTFTVPVLALANNDMKAINEQLKIKIKQAPEFFKNSPLLIDLQEISNPYLELDLIQLIDVVRKLGLIPIGIRGGSEPQQQTALTQGMAVFSIHSGNTENFAKQKKISTHQQEPSEKQEDETNASDSKLLTQPVRSGQRIYAHGDLIILAQVSAGAEIMAEGNIHVYGALRGRALAGVLGNTNSRIFCSDLQAELISIAGHYQVSEELDNTTRNKPVQIFLKDQALIIKET